MFYLSKLSPKAIGRCWMAYREQRPPLEMLTALRDCLPCSEARSLISVLSSPEPSRATIDQMIFGIEILAPEDQQQLSKSLAFMLKLRESAATGHHRHLTRLLKEYRDLIDEHAH